MRKVNASTSHAGKSGRRIFGFFLILVGLWLVVFGNAWAPVVLERLPDSEIGAWLELIVPFLPLLFIGTGAVTLTRITSA
jgi:hypothetical protein